MTTVAKKPVAAALYDRDFFLWTQEQSRALAARRTRDIDWDSVAEEIASVGRSEKKEIRSRLIRLLHDLLKWEFQPQRRSHGWQSTISGQRIHIQGTIDDSPSLGNDPAEILATAYRTGREAAIRETGLPDRVFPEDCPYAVEDVLSHDFMPGAAWSPNELIRD